MRIASCNFVKADFYFFFQIKVGNFLHYYHCYHYFNGHHFLTEERGARKITNHRIVEKSKWHHVFASGPYGYWLCWQPCWDLAMQSPSSCCSTTDMTPKLMYPSNTLLPYLSPRLPFVTRTPTGKGFFIQICMIH